MTLFDAQLLKDKMEAFRLATGKSDIDYMNQAGFNALLESKKAFFLTRNNGANLTPGQAVNYKSLEEDCMILSDWIKSTRKWDQAEQKAAERLVGDITSDEFNKILIQLEQQANKSKPVSLAKSSGIIKTTAQYITYPVRLLWQLVVLLGFYNKSSTIKLSTANEMLRSINPTNPPSPSDPRRNFSGTKTGKTKRKTQYYALPSNPFHADSSYSFTRLANVFKTEKKHLMDANEQAIRTINSSNKGPEHVIKRDKLIHEQEEKHSFLFDKLNQNYKSAVFSKMRALLGQPRRGGYTDKTIDKLAKVYLEKKDKGQSTPDLDAGYKLLLSMKKPTTKVHDSSELKAKERIPSSQEGHNASSTITPSAPPTTPEKKMPAFGAVRHSVPNVRSTMHSAQSQYSRLKKPAEPLDHAHKSRDLGRFGNSSFKDLRRATHSRDQEILLSAQDNHTETAQSESRERVAGHPVLNDQQPPSLWQKVSRYFSNKTSPDTITLSSTPTPTPERVVADQSTNNGRLPLNSTVESSIQVPEVQELNDQPVRPIHSKAQTKIPTYPTRIKDDTLHQKLNEYLKANPHPDGWTAAVHPLNDINLIIKHSDKDHNLLPQHDIEVHDTTVTARVSLEASEDDINYMANTMFNAYVLSGGDANALNLDTIKHPRMKEALVRIRAECLADEQAEEHRVQP